MNEQLQRQMAKKTASERDVYCAKKNDKVYLTLQKDFVWGFTMPNKNSNLHNAKRNRDDEFYTTYETVENEVSHYEEQFYDKVVYCNCDNPFESNFSKFFLKNFNRLHLSRLIVSS